MQARAFTTTEPAAHQRYSGLVSVQWNPQVVRFAIRASKGSGVSAGAENIVGLIGRVTVPIPANGLGEVMLPVRGGTEAFAAWSDRSIEKHAQVLVVEYPSGRSVVVTPFP